MTPRQLAGLRRHQPRTASMSVRRSQQPCRHLSRPSIVGAISSLAAPFLPRPPPASPLAALRSGASDLLAAVDPLKLVGSELGNIRANVRRLLGSRHPALDTIAKYYLGSNEGKQIRPLIVLLVAQASNGISPAFERIWGEAMGPGSAGKGKGKSAADAIDEPLSSADILNDANPSLFTSPSTSSSNPDSSVLPTQLRLAEITEMIHVASLLHDDVIDAATSRRGQPSSPSQFGNKLSILAGDFLLARASVALSRLGSLEVVELVASVLANLVEGEVMQMKGNTPTSSRPSTPFSSSSKGLTPEIFDHYMRKTYLKTASLIAKSSRAATILGGCGIRSGWAAGEKINDGAYAFGRNLGIAFQVCSSLVSSLTTHAHCGVILTARRRLARLYRFGLRSRQTCPRRGP